MEYINQIECLYNFFNLKLSSEQMKIALDIKKSFNNDLNLLGCFFKDYLILRNPCSIPDDSDIYNELMLCFEFSSDIDELLDEIKNYARYYLMIVFEDIKHAEIQGIVSMINSCYELDVYPLIMKLFESYHHKKITLNKLIAMLKAIADIVIKKFENPTESKTDFIKELITIKDKERRLVS